MKPCVISLPKAVAVALVGMVLTAKNLRSESAARTLLTMPTTELWRLALEAYEQNASAFENLPMHTHEQLTFAQSNAIRLALTLGSVSPITSLPAPRVAA